MYAHSVQGLNRRTASYLAAPECEETSLECCYAALKTGGSPRGFRYALGIPALPGWARAATSWQCHPVPHNRTAAEQCILRQACICAHISQMRTGAMHACVAMHHLQ